MNTILRKDSDLPFQQSYGELARFIGDFSHLMSLHLEVVASTLSATAASLDNEVNEIASKGRADLERGDSFQIKNPQTELFQTVRISKSDPLFNDPVGLARPVSDTMALHMSNIKVLESSLGHFLSSLEVVKTVDQLSLQRLQQEINALRALNEAMQQVLVQYRVCGEISHEFVEQIKRDLLSALQVDVSGSNKARVFSEFLGR